MNENGLSAEGAGHVEAPPAAGDDHEVGVVPGADLQLAEDLGGPAVEAGRHVRDDRGLFGRLSR